MKKITRTYNHSASQRESAFCWTYVWVKFIILESEQNSLSGPQTSDLKMITSQNTNEPYGLSLGQALFSIIWLQAVLQFAFSK